jgi:hypothetical protein
MESLSSSSEMPKPYSQMSFEELAAAKDSAVADDDLGALSGIGQEAMFRDGMDDTDPAYHYLFKECIDIISKPGTQVV